MGNYMRPDVYVERVNDGTPNIETTGTSTAGMVGIAPRGVMNEAVFVTSWTDYVNKFARGLNSPFFADSDLAYSVYGFFQNGGNKLFVTRIGDGSEAKAVATIGVEEIELEAVDAGTWANEKLKVEVVADGEQFNFIVKFNGEIVELFENVNAETGDENFIIEVVNNGSKFVKITSATALDEGEASFLGGKDGIENLEDLQYIEALKTFDFADDIALIAIPGQTTKPVAQGLLDYCEAKKTCFAVLDMPMGLEPTEAVSYKKELANPYGAIYYPWGNIVDPIGRGKMRLTPPSGHILGVFARTDNERGVHKAPAGLEAQIKGFVETERKLSNEDLEILNSKNINAIIARPNQGIVVWGARLLKPHLDRKYVSDTRLDLNIETTLYNNTQWTLFEPNDEALWNRLESQIKAYMISLWTDGALYGASPEEAFFVKCDAELNPPEVRAQGRVIANVGYAKQNTTEFTIIRLSQKTAEV